MDIDITKPQLPTIHINGTGAENLEKEYSDLVEKISATLDSLCVATCNARDFYPQGNEAWERARAERTEALRLLRQVNDYALAWAFHAIYAKK